MKFSYCLPTHRVDRGEEFASGAGIAELALAAQDAGFDAVYVTDHPFPADRWLQGGGHHSLDPLVALSFAAAATETIRLQTHLLILGYRNPFLAAKGVASLDQLSRGRVILGVGAGYLEEEFDALGASFPDRNERLDEAIVAMRAAWAGTSVELSGQDFHAAGNTMLPRPRQRPGPPIWIGGNSRRAIRRAVELAQGWSPFAASARMAARAQTAVLEGAAGLTERLEFARAHAAVVGRTEPLDVCFTPPSLTMGSAKVIDELDPVAITSACAELEGLGVTWVALALPGETRDEQCEALNFFSASVMSQLRAHED